MDLIPALYVVPTPIGNLEDISQRALNVLENVDLIACEDTRHSGKLLSHYGITTKTTALHDHNEKQRASWFVEQIRAGLKVALISDAGTPLISDPGYHLVNTLREAQQKVIPLPGASAMITALSGSGLPSDRFSFEGFLPAKEKARLELISQLSQDPRTLIFYESPRRIIFALTAINQVIPERELVLARELTKTFETFHRGNASELISFFEQFPEQQKGEMVLMVKGYRASGDDLSVKAIATLELLAAEMPLKKAAAITAQIFNLKKNLLYKYGLEHF
ncbi:16S rRNA (cytidine(1402)-2'-O)-methyltransferase [Paraferrimonas sp. SM1919]|uniref:16S rRNA (cytidine(1402)-2'-O)-methyltransferase n=1 Tax=Paraferrimonas sp. SM1919 TaxID=2662263 RepID=UPI0013D84B40|nr:16S rRNA (cytidine(1402)-2'-O)-methyltransferase [Paraferrimonas sp. SM1919]